MPHLNVVVFSSEGSLKRASHTYQRPRNGRKPGTKNLNFLKRKKGCRGWGSGFGFRVSVDFSLRKGSK